MRNGYYKKCLIEDRVPQADIPCPFCNKPVAGYSLAMSTHIRRHHVDIDAVTRLTELKSLFPRNYDGYGKK